MNYLGESEFSTETSVVSGSSYTPVACIMREVNPFNTALFGTSMPGLDPRYRPFLQPVAFDTPGSWPSYFFRPKTEHITSFSNNACNIGIDIAGYYKVEGSVTLESDINSTLTFSFSTYNPGDSLDDWAPDDNGVDAQLVVMGARTQFNFSSLGYFNAMKVFELTLFNGGPSPLQLNIFNYRLSITKL